MKADIVGVRIKERREALQMSQEDLAQLVGYKSRASINKIELGRTDLPQSRLTKIAQALDTTESYLLGWTEYADMASDTLAERRLSESKIDMLITDQYECNLVKAFRQLNDSGKLECMSHMEYLLTQERYTKDTTSLDA